MLTRSQRRESEGSRQRSRSDPEVSFSQDNDDEDSGREELEDQDGIPTQNDREIVGMLAEEQTEHSNDPSLRRRPPIVVAFDVQVQDLYKYTKEIKEYSQSSHEQFKTFESKFSAFLNKVGVASNANTSLKKILSGEHELSEYSENLLRMTLNDFLVGRPNEDTKSIRESDAWKDRFKTTWKKLESAFPEDLGTQYRKELMSLKYKANESIQKYNQTYRNAFERCRSMNRATTGVVSIDDYLNSLPSHPIIRSIKLALSVRLHQLTLSEVMSHVATSIIGVSENARDNLIGDTVHMASEKPKEKSKPQHQKSQQKPRPKNNNSNGKHKCDTCGLWTHHGPESCIAREADCRNCGQIGHFAKMCPNKETAPQDFNVVHCISDQGMEPSEHQIGIDTCATVSVLNDRNYFLTLEPSDQPIELADNSYSMTDGTGTALISLKTIDGKEKEFKVKAHFIAKSSRCLLSVHQLVKLGMNVDLANFRLVHKDSEFKLFWSQSMLMTRCVPPSKPRACLIKAGDYQIWHERLGHPNKEAMKKMLDIDVPSSFNCPECSETNRKDVNPKVTSDKEAFRQDLKFFEECSLDVMYSKPDRNDIKCHLIFIESKSRIVSAVPLHSLDAQTAVDAVLKICVTFQKVPSKLTVDRGPAFTSQLFQKWCLSEGIKLEFCSPHSHQQNGIAERVIQTLRRKATSLLNSARLDVRFFSEALQYAVQLYNRTFHSSINKVPMSEMINKPVNEDYLRRFKKFGSVVFYDDGIGIFLGPDYNSTEGTILILSESRNVVRRNMLAVAFDETLLSRRKLPALQDLFVGLDTLKIIDTYDQERIEMDSPAEVLYAPVVAQVSQKSRATPAQDCMKCPTYFHQVRFLRYK